MPLAGLCSTDLGGAAVGYLVNSRQAQFVTCPGRGASITVQPFISEFGATACRYDGTTLSVTCECCRRPQVAPQPIRARKAGTAV